MLGTISQCWCWVWCILFWSYR